MTPPAAAFSRPPVTVDPDAAPQAQVPAEPGFEARHMGLPEADRQAMLDTIGVGSVEALMEQTVPAAIQSEGPLQLEGLDPQHALSETEALARLHGYAESNRVTRPMLGMGYHGTITPEVIKRNVLENPLWYTPYTPYQAEIAQGRLEALLTFQTMVSELVGLPLAGASLLDEATAAAEAMAMCFNIARQKKKRFLVADDCHPQTIAVVKTRARGLGIAVEVAAPEAIDCSAGDVCGILLQYPATDGYVGDYAALTAKAQEHGALVVAATDLLACCLLTPPGEWGADIAVGSAQRFGVPMGYGGPHAAFLATKDAYARKMPGRLIGISKDAEGKRALRMAIQTREQHIRRDKATSNICTAQALLANIAAFYGVYHGPEGLRAIAQRVHDQARGLLHKLTGLGMTAANDAFFDTVSVEVGEAEAKAILERASGLGILLRESHPGIINIVLDETTTDADLVDVVDAVWAEHVAEYDEVPHADDAVAGGIPDGLQRTTGYLTQDVFNRYHTEHEMMRFLHRLVSLDYGLVHGMVPLGSCTMKLNSAAEMAPVTWPGFGGLHPFCPPEDALGYKKLFDELELWLAEITGFAAVSLQPNAGSQGEYAGLLAIRSYHQANGDDQRVKCLIPTSAHGTNPASAVIAGLEVVPVACADNGDIDLNDLRAKAEQCGDTLAAMMITYPSTHGVFEEGIREACEIVHSQGGQVYMDGANMNAQVGLTSPGLIGADVCHLNLHKTFCIPHGGGGPGMGPIGVAAHLAEHLPGDPLGEGAGEAHDAVSAAPYGSPSILPISWMYIAMMGSGGLKRASEQAILNANYMAARLRGHYDILYTGPSGTVAHEFIVDCRPFDKACHITVEDVAKRLMDYGFHGPTMSWPVAGTLMIEPTESESKAELDRFCDAMIGIREEIAKVESGEWPEDNNPLKHAPHPASAVSGEAWDRPYPRKTAAYPASGQDLPGVKFWPSVSRIDQPYGDRNLVCTCEPMESYGE